MKRVLTATALACTVAASTATAQYTSQPSTYGSERESKADLVLLGGYAFTLSEDVYPTGATAGGELDVKDAAFWGIALDFNVVRQPGKQGQLRLMYRREDSEITFRPFVPGDPSVTRDAFLEYWQIGGLGGVKRGKAMPLTSVTLGGTHWGAGDIDDWGFSMIFGLGVKVYTSPKVGIMIQGNWPITFTDMWGGAYVGTGGASVGVSGTGVSQIDVGGGLIISF